MSDAQLPLILIVDDSATTRAMIKRIVNMAEPVIARMIEAPNGAEGLRQMRENRVDVVFADLNMPVMDGFAMIEAMRHDEQLSTIPVVVISAQPDPQAVEKLKSQGVAAYLPKPFRAEDVHSIVGPLLEAAAKLAIDPATAALNDLVPNALAEAL
jgi:two-component system chemotaxis response regulator CheY